jgi:hypothetical protein
MKRARGTAGRSKRARVTMLAAGCLLALAGAGCGAAARPGAVTQSPLALERVVLYRNGVGYFERRGAVDGQTLHLKVRKDQVNDLLKSLAVVDRSSGQVLGVSLPLDPQSWHKLALSALAPGQGRLSEVLDGLRGTRVRIETARESVAGRIVLVERMRLEPSEIAAAPNQTFAPPRERSGYEDYRVTLLDGDRMSVVQLSKIRSLTLEDGDVVMQLDRHLDASAGEGIFQQVDLTLRLSAGARHDLSLSYVAPAPLWQPTYRIVLDGEKHEALLQAWAVVDNTSGESWDDVQLSLTSGAPIAFRYDLHTPREVERPDLTSSAADKRAQVALGERTYSEDERAAQAPMQGSLGGGAGAAADKGAAAPEAELAEDAPSRSMRAPSGKKVDASANGIAPPMAPATAPAPAPPPAMTLQALQDSGGVQASARRIAGLTQFDVPGRVTLPDGSATMVALVNQRVGGEQVFLYRPGGSGQGYELNPYRVVRFRNDTDFVLEPGPIGIFADGSFVGEGLSEAIGSHELATIPFAVEPSISVRSRVLSTGDETRTVKLVQGVLEVEAFHRVSTEWTVSGQKRAAPYRVLIRHPRQGGPYALLSPKKDVEELPDAYFVPIDVAANATESSVTVVEQTPTHGRLSIWDGAAVELLDTLLSSGELDADTRRRLQPIVDKRRQIGRIDAELASLQAQQGELDQRVNETRESLRAIQKDPRAAALRKKLGERLDQFLRDADGAGRRIVELQSQRLQLKVELEDLLADPKLGAGIAAPAVAQEPATAPPSTPSAPPSGGIMATPSR